MLPPKFYLFLFFLRSPAWCKLTWPAEQRPRTRTQSLEPLWGCFQSCTCLAEAWRRRGAGPSDAAPLIVRWPSWDNRRREKSRPSSSNGCWQKATVFQLTPPAAMAQCHDVWRLATKVLLCHSSLPSPAWPRGLVPPPIASDIFSCEPTAWRWTPRKKVGRRRDSQHPEEGPCW